MTINSIQRITPLQNRPYNTNSITFTAVKKPPLNIKSRGNFPANILSNFANTNFIFDGIKIKSIEGFLQSLKSSDKNKQVKICQMSGFEAKTISKLLKQDKNEMLMFWKDKVFRRDSDTFKELLHKVIEVAKQNSNYENFIFEGEKINSVNSFLQGIKAKDAHTRKQIIQEPIKIALEKAKIVIPEYDFRELHWNGKTFKRNSTEYQSLLTRIYDARYDNDLLFRQAIRASKKYKLFHSKGKNNQKETVLTIDEFLSQITRLQNKNSRLQQIKDFATLLVERLKQIYKK